MRPKRQHENEAKQDRGGRGHPKRGRRRKRPFDHGDLRLMTLDLIADQPRHGYEIIKQIEQRFDGAYAPSPGAIYPTLAWLEDTGFAQLEKTEGGKKSAVITGAGRAFLEANSGAAQAIWARKAALTKGRAPREILSAMDSLKTALRSAVPEASPERIREIAGKIEGLAGQITQAPTAPAGPVITRHRFEPKRRTLTVRSVTRLTPHMVRVVLTGEELADFVSPSPDDHIKLFFPGGGEKPLMRDYTPRAFDNAAQSLTLDFAIHDAGPATAWALEAAPGDSLQIGGPRGSSVIEGDFDWWLMIGDETALPAIGRRAEELPEGPRVLTLAAVPGPEDEQRFETKATLTPHWVHRPAEAAADPAPLLEAARRLELPEGRGFVWIAAEAQVARALKGHFLTDRGHPAELLKAAGYWVAGQAATSDKSL